MNHKSFDYKNTKRIACPQEGGLIEFRGGLKCIAECLGKATPSAHSEKQLSVDNFVCWIEWNS